MIPQEEHPDINFVGLLIGETGCTTRRWILSKLLVHSVLLKQLKFGNLNLFHYLKSLEGTLT